jgi:hypothetical protein
MHNLLEGRPSVGSRKKNQNLVTSISTKFYDACAGVQRYLFAEAFRPKVKAVFRTALQIRRGRRFATARAIALHRSNSMPAASSASTFRQVLCSEVRRGNSNPLATTTPSSHRRRMRTVEQIQSDIRQLSPEEMRKIRDFLDDIVEDDLEFTDAFESQMRESEAEMNQGLRPRTRKP